MRRFFYQPDVCSQPQAPSPCFSPLKVGQSLPLTDSIFHHWCRVLRAKQGDQAIFFDGHGGEYIIKLQQVDKKSAQASVLAHHDVERSNDFHTHIALVMSRGDRMDYALQKATELGVNSIQLLSSQHGEVSLKPNQVDKKMAHWQQVMLAACEQCGLNRPPLLYSPLTIKDWLEGQHGQPCDTLSYLASQPYYQNQPLSHLRSLRLVLAVPETNCSEAQTSTTSMSMQQIMQHIQQANKDNVTPAFTLLIGAEGGLSKAEIKQALTKKFNPWQLGERILRTETAPVAALTTLQTLAVLSK